MQENEKQEQLEWEQDQRQPLKAEGDEEEEGEGSICVVVSSRTEPFGDVDDVMSFSALDVVELRHSCRCCRRYCPSVLGICWSGRRRSCHRRRHCRHCRR